MRNFSLSVLLDFNLCGFFFFGILPPLTPKKFNLRKMFFERKHSDKLETFTKYWIGGGVSGR